MRVVQTNEPRFDDTAPEIKPSRRQIQRSPKGSACERTYCGVFHLGRPRWHDSALFAPAPTPLSLTLGALRRLPLASTRHPVAPVTSNRRKVCVADGVLLRETTLPLGEPLPLTLLEDGEGGGGVGRRIKLLLDGHLRTHRLPLLELRTLWGREEAAGGEGRGGR